MQARESSARRPRSRIAYANQIPMRTGELCQRGKHLCEGCWDINAALLLAEDAEALASACHLLDDAKTANRLEDFAECLWALLDPPSIPDGDTVTEISRHLAKLGGTNEPQPASSDERPGDEATLFGYAATEANGFPLLVRPPAQYWQRFGALASARKPAASSPQVPEQASRSAAEAPAAGPAPAAAPPATPVPAAQPATAIPTAVAAVDATVQVDAVELTPFRKACPCVLCAVA